MAAPLVTLFLPAAIVDLSQPWAAAPGYNVNDAAKNLTAAVNTYTRSYLLLKGGKKVAEYYRSGTSETTTSDMWSVTKSWSSLLIGMLSLSVTSTLETILPATTNWAAVTDQAAKKAMTLENLLTMTSGLVDPTDWPSQNSLVEVLNHGTYDASKVRIWQYLSATHILAMVIKYASGGIEPETFALGASGVFPALGITAQSFSWLKNSEGDSGSAFGLKMTVGQMAKLGQLYLQNGKASASNQLVSSAWVAQSTAWDTYWGEWPFTSCDGLFRTEKLTGYGYQFWNWRSKRAGYSDVDYYCAVGHLGQFMCVYPSLDAVFATASDQYAGGCALLGHIPKLLLDGADATGFQLVPSGWDNLALYVGIGVGVGVGVPVLLIGLGLALWYRHSKAKKARRVGVGARTAATVDAAAAGLAAEAGAAEAGMSA